MCLKTKEFNTSMCICFGLMVVLKIRLHKKGGRITHLLMNKTIWILHQRTVNINGSCDGVLVI